MPKGKYTRKEASILAYCEVVGILQPSGCTFPELQKNARDLPVSVRRECHLYYIVFMSFGRPEYIQKYAMRHTPCLYGLIEEIENIKSKLLIKITHYED